MRPQIRRTKEEDKKKRSFSIATFVLMLPEEKSSVGGDYPAR
jgi:hypothetical protein